MNSVILGCISRNVGPDPQDRVWEVPQNRGHLVHQNKWRRPKNEHFYPSNRFVLWPKTGGLFDPLFELLGVILGYTPLAPRITVIALIISDKPWFGVLFSVITGYLA